MYMLYKQGFIEHYIVSIYMRQKSGNFSSVKFGSYDEGAIAPGNDLIMYKTIRNNEWVLGATGF